MSDNVERPDSIPRWLHAWAVLTVLAALPLVILGAEVTTKQVGMVDQVGLREPWYFFTLDLRQTPLGPLIEHGHRQVGFVVGNCCIVLALALALVARRPLVRWSGCVALLAVSVQGLLGIFRVNLNALFGETLKTIHGCFAQLVFALLLSVAILTSRTWATPVSAFANLKGARRLALGLSVLTYVQIVFGAVMRHLFDPAAQRLHILLAFAVVGLTILLVRQLWAADPDLVPPAPHPPQAGGDRAARRVSVLLLAFLCVQPILGLEAWIQRFGTGQLPELVRSSPLLDTVRSGHHVLGTVIFATTVALNVLLWRRAVVALPVSTESGSLDTQSPPMAPVSRPTSESIRDDHVVGSPIGSAGGAR